MNSTQIVVEGLITSYSNVSEKERCYRVFIFLLSIISRRPYNLYSAPLRRKDAIAFLSFFTLLSAHLFSLRNCHSTF